MAALEPQRRVGPQPDFECFYRETARAVVAYCSRSGLEPQEVADVVSETFARALLHRARYSAAQGSPLAWLLGITQNVIREDQRSRSMATSVSARLLEQRPSLTERDVAEIVALKTDARLVLEAIADLDETEQRLILGGASPSAASDASRKRLSRGLAGVRLRIRSQRGVS